MKGLAHAEERDLAVLRFEDRIGGNFSGHAKSRVLDALTTAARAASGLGEARAVAKDMTTTQAGARDGDEFSLLAGSGAGDVAKVGVDLFDGDA